MGPGTSAWAAGGLRATPVCSWGLRLMGLQPPGGGAFQGRRGRGQPSWVGAFRVVPPLAPASSSLSGYLAEPSADGWGVVSLCSIIQ